MYETQCSQEQRAETSSEYQRMIVGQRMDDEKQETNKHGEMHKPAGTG
jgi:hypothetical protein